jgi:uncharacterized protein YndB with AHSA1/START domain
MRWVWIGLGVLLGIPALVAIVGSLLPRDHVATVAIELRAAPERVWALVSDFTGAARWRKDISKVELLPSSGGPVRFVEHGKQGKTPFQVVSQEPPRRQVVKVVDEGQPFGGTWTWELAPAAGGTRLSITEAGFVKNPIFRVMSKLFFSPSATLETYLKALAAELGESAIPVSTR